MYFCKIDTTDNMEHYNQQLSSYTKESKCMNFFFHTLLGENALKGVHRHDFYQIILLEKGTANHVIDFELYKMPTHSVSVLFPHQVHNIELSPDAKATVILFDSLVFCSEMLRNELKDYNIDLQKRINFLSLENNPKLFGELMELIDNIRTAYVDMNPVRKMIIKLRIKIILLKIIDALPDATERISSESDTVLYSRFREQVDANFREQRKVQYYANLLGISAKKLTSVCQHYSGLSPLEIIHDKLSLELKKAIALEELSFKEIAYDFGFSSQSALNKYIGLKFNMTPLEFKEDLQRRILGKNLR